MMSQWAPTAQDHARVLERDPVTMIEIPDSEDELALFPAQEMIKCPT